MSNATNTQFAKYKEDLLKEQTKLIEAMQTMGQLTDLIPGDWETHTDPDQMETSLDDLPNKYEEETTNEGVLETLEERLREVTDALERIETKTFGMCINCAMNNKNTQIEPERLDANATATTCVACSHLNP